MPSGPEWARPSLSSVTLAGVAEAVAVAVQYRTTVTDVGMGVWRHSYWPWYVHAHGDAFTPADPLLFALNFLTGVALFLPLTHAVTTLARRTDAWPPARFVGRAVLRPGLAKTAVTFAGVVALSAVGDSATFNAFALPGLLVTVAGIVAVRTALGAVPVGLSNWLALPYAVSLPVLWLAVSWLAERRPGHFPASVDTTRWLLGRDEGRTRRHLRVAAAVAAVAVLAVTAGVVLDAYPTDARWYERTAIVVAGLTAAVQAYRNDGLLVSMAVAAGLLAALLYPKYDIVGAGGVAEYVPSVALFGALIGGGAFCLAVLARGLGRQVRARVRSRQ